MSIKIAKNQVVPGLISLVEEKTGVNLNRCYQCKKCSVGCPVAGQVKAAPAEIIRRLQLGAGDELLHSDLVWTCLSCDTCSARCPNDIDFAAIIDALRSIAVEKGIGKNKDSGPLFNRIFLNTVKNYGRSYDLQMIALHKLRTGNIRQDMEKFPTMLKKGKIALLPPTGGNKRQVRKIFQVTQQKEKI
jgi:heterodisulfide reductase subunit C